MGKSGGGGLHQNSSKKETCASSAAIPNIDTSISGNSSTPAISTSPNSKSVSVPNLSYSESSSTTISPPTSAFSSSPSNASNNLNNASNSLFDGLSAIARVRSLINSSRFPSLSHNNPQMMNMNSSASNPATHHQQQQQQNRTNNDLNQNPNNPFLFGRTTPHSVSSLVRIALSSNFPGLKLFKTLILSHSMLSFFYFYMTIFFSFSLKYYIYFMQCN